MKWSTRAKLWTFPGSTIDEPRPRKLLLELLDVVDPRVPPGTAAVVEALVSHETNPQERAMCACPSFSTPRQCIRIRYNVERYSSDDSEEECECSCHHEDDDDTDDGSAW